MAAKVLDGRYKLIKKLGAGGFGQTYIARDMRRPGSPMCVVKQLKPNRDDPDFIRQARRLFNTEAEVLEKLGKHDQIPQLLAYFEEGNHFFLVQEFIEGTTLDQEWQITPPAQSDSKVEPDSETSLRAKPQPKLIGEREALLLLKDVLGILEFVHSEGVIHRDIKPENLIRRKADGKIVLIDFGAVKSFQSEQAQIDSQNGSSRFTVTIGTLGYTSSEQMAGRPNFTSDLYSLGMVVIRGITGIAPTELPTHPDTGEVIWKDKARVSNGLAMVLTRMTRYSYPQRFQSAKEALQGISALCPEDEATRPTLPKPATVRSRRSGLDEQERTYIVTSTHSNSGAGLLIGGLLALIAIALAGVPVALNSRREAKPPSEPVVIAPTSPTPTVAPPSLDRPLASRLETVTFDNFGRFITSGLIPINTELVFPVQADASSPIKIDIADPSVVTMTITTPDNQPLLPSTVNVTTFQGQMPASGQIQIKVRSLRPENNTNYSLSISRTSTNSQGSTQM